MSLAKFPALRLRRFRRTAAHRALFGEPFPGPEKFLWPLFIVPGAKAKIPIEAMPGQFRYGVEALLKDLEPVAGEGVGGVLLFGVPDERDKSSDGRLSACRESGIVQKAIKRIKAEFPSLLVFTDVCLCEHTKHGHCGVLDRSGASVDNDATLGILAEMAVSHARAGADGVAPSAMMDGQVAALRNALSEAKFDETLLMSYSTKFASSLYGPFREAAGSAPGKGDRKGYQASFSDPKRALLESSLDEAEGADILMVKPALFYLDLLAKLRERTELPLAAYNVSGEYSMLHASAARGWGDLDRMAREGLMAIQRAGAEIIISYWANQYGRLAKGAE
jgi:porphobilinogen synthase